MAREKVNHAEAVDENRGLYQAHYNADSVRLAQADTWEQRLAALRQDYLMQFGSGKRVLDLCCGTGAYLAPFLPHCREGIGLDFSQNMLVEFQGRYGEAPPANLQLVEGDATAIPLTDGSVDLVVSYTSLYNVPNLDKCVAEIGRVLAPGGRAVLEVGNRASLNHWVAQGFFSRGGWARPHMVSLRDFETWCAKSGLKKTARHAFQLLPMYGAPMHLFFLMPLASKAWRRVMGQRVGHRVVDEIVSGSWPLRAWAFRHFYVLQKQG